MEIARKGLTRLLCLLDESRQQHESSTKQEALWKEKPVIKGGLRRGCALHLGWWGERNPSITVLTYWEWKLLHPLVQKAWAQQALLTGLSWELSGPGSVLGAGLWRRTGAGLKAYLHCVSVEFVCCYSKEVTLRAAWGKGEPATLGGTGERLSSSIATPLHTEC